MIFFPTNTILSRNLIEDALLDLQYSSAPDNKASEILHQNLQLQLQGITQTQWCCPLCKFFTEHDILKNIITEF